MKYDHSSFFLCILMLFTGASAQAVTFSDAVFDSGDWAVSVLYSNNGTGGSSAQNVAGGNPGAFRFMTHSEPSGHPTTDSFIWVFHEYLGAVYQPSVDGPIAGLDYSEDQIEFSPPFAGAAIAARPALIQGGVVFAGPDMTFNATSWQSVGLTGLVAADFFDFNSSPFLGGDGLFDNPDFLATGGAIRFGYIRGNSTVPGSGDIVTYHGIDNWSVAVNATPVPLAPGVVYLGSALLGLGWLRRIR